MYLFSYFSLILLLEENTKNVFSGGDCMTKTEILRITKPGDIFPNDETKCKLKYKDYIKQYHPDVKGGDADVFEHITKLYKEAIKLIKTGEWEKTNYIELKTKEGKTFQINYLYTSDFEIGTYYVCKRHLIYIIDEEQGKYYKNYLEMETVMKRTMPEVIKNGQLANGDFYIVISKTEDVYPLILLLKSVKRLDPKHVAWMISRLSSICCFLEYNEIVHNGITLESCFVSPQYHSILLLGGWWYAVDSGKEMIGTTGEIYDLMPVTAKTSKMASTITDLESVKLIGRQLFDEKSCRTLKMRKDIPDPIINFLVKGSSDNAIEEMTDWDNSLTDAYGKRKFVELNVTSEQIYKYK